MHFNPQQMDDAEIIAFAAKHGVTITRRGAVWHLRSRTIDCSVADLSYLSITDISPPGAAARPLESLSRL